jgi:MFS family permease
MVSLFADIASEMLYPVIPSYLREIGFTVVWIGLLEGLANFTSGISKGYFGKKSDEQGLRLPFIRLGYFLSALSKPMLAIFAYPAWVFFARITDRLGKGLRTAPRDALLSQNATPQTKARVFGFHRAMDTVGAAIGPCLALFLLVVFPGAYKTVFLIAFIPGLISVALVYLVREQKQAASSTLGRGNFFSFFRYWKIAPPAYKKLTAGLLFLALFNSSDIFLLLKTREVSGSVTLSIQAYILYNLVFAAASFPLGILADRVGIKRVFMAGLLLFAMVYFLFGTSNSVFVLFLAFSLYGVFAAATEGISKAWISNLSHGQNTATALGFYTSCESICTLLASIVAGAVWTGLGSIYTFLITAASALLAFVYFALVIREEKPQETEQIPVQIQEN